MYRLQNHHRFVIIGLLGVVLIVLAGCGNTTVSTATKKSAPSVVETPKATVPLSPSPTTKPVATATPLPTVAPSRPSATPELTATPVLPTPTPPSPAQGSKSPTFVDDIQPIFAARCVKCHSGSSAPRGLQLDTYEHVMKGTAYRPVIIPGKPDESILVKRIKGIARPRMPFDGPPFLSDEQIATIVAWIAAGAPER